MNSDGDAIVQPDLEGRHVRDHLPQDRGAVKEGHSVAKTSCAWSRDASQHQHEADLAGIEVVLTKHAR